MEEADILGRRSMRKAALFTLTAAMVLASCASMRKVDVTSDPNTSYRISVHNSRSSAIVVSYSDGNTTRELGQVGGGQTTQFVVVAANPQVTVMSRTTAGTTLSSKTVNLSAGSTTPVTIN
jgi:uncharacterized lipoprotein YajG